MQLLAEINLEKILSTLSQVKPMVAVIDSIQTIYSEALQSAPGSVAQVRECAAQLTRLRQTVGHLRDPGRTCDQRGRPGRAARAGTHRRYRAVFRGRHTFELSPGAGVQESLSVRSTNWACSP
jgi:hypothetical protein